MTVPSAMVNAANRLVMLLRSSSWVRRSGMPGSIGRTGWERSSAWIWDLLVHAQHHCTLGRVVIQPDDIDDLVDNSGSVDSLKLSVRCGLRPKVRQIRPILDVLSPDLSAICLRDQWVASRGVSSSVATITPST
jgi:hypothetical protein